MWTLALERSGRHIPLSPEQLGSVFWNSKAQSSFRVTVRVSALRGDKGSHLLLPLETEQDRPSRVASHYLAWCLGGSPSEVVRTIWKSNSLKAQPTEEGIWVYLQGLLS